MAKRFVDRIPFAKIVTVLAITFGVSLGLCGLTFVFGAAGHGNSGTLVMNLGIFELAAMAFSAVGLILTAIAWVVLAAVASFGESAKQPQKLLDDEGDTKHNRQS